MSMTIPRVLLIEPMYHGAGEALLRETCEVRVLAQPSRDEVMKAVGEAHALCARYPHRIDDFLLAAAPSVVIAACSGRGADAIDIAAASARGVAVVNNPGFGPIPVTEQALGFMLALAKRFAFLDAKMRSGEGWDHRGLGAVAELEGKTLGIVGLGAIGSEMARKCRLAFHMNVLAYDPYIQTSKAETLDVQRVATLDELLASSDFVSMHPELNDGTRGMIGERELRRIKPSAYLINTARGKVVQQAALVRALHERWIAGAALDVYEDEPMGADNPLYDCDNLILSPHIAGLSDEAVRGMSLSAATQILQALHGERPAHVLNPESWERAAARARSLDFRWTTEERRQ